MASQMNSKKKFGEQLEDLYLNMLQESFEIGIFQSVCVKLSSH